jgi:hypothetical protein
MMIEVKVGDEILQFPEGMSDQEIKRIIDKQYGVAERPVEEQQSKAPIAEEEWYEDPTMASRMVLDGLTLGWADEVGAAIAAGMVKLTGQDNGASYGEIYDSMIGSLTEEQKAYEEAHPVASTGLKIAGGIASPIPMGKAVQSVTKAGGGMLAKTSVGALEGAVIGSVYGAGSAEQGEKGEGARTGAAWGAGGSLAMSAIAKGGGAVWNSVAKKRIAEDLKKADGTFKPITLAESGTQSTPAVQSLYKDLFGQTLITGKGFREQEQRFIDHIRKQRDLTSKGLEQAKQEADDALRALKDEKNLVQVPGIREKFIELKEAVRSGAKDAKDNFSLMKASIEGTAKKLATQKVDDAVEAQAQAWRRDIIANATPKGVGAKQAAEIFKSNDPLGTIGRLERAWSQKGFDSLHSHSFRFEPEAIIAKMEKALSKDFGKIYNNQDIRRMAAEVVENAMSSKSGGWVKGTTLANLRSAFGSKAATQGDNSREAMLRTEAFTKLRNIIDDDVITPQLAKLKDGGKALANFRGDKDAWGTVVALRKAVESSAKNPKQQGAFGPQEWLTALGQSAGTLTRRGEAKFQKQAYQLASSMASRDKFIQKTAQRVVKDQLKGRTLDLKRQRADVAKQLKELRAQERAAVGRLSKSTYAREKAIKNNSKLTELNKQEAVLKDEVARLEQMASSGTGKGGSLFKEIVATGVLGALAVPFTGGAPILSLGGGLLLGKLATTQTGQLLFAGQTGLQKGMQQIAQKAGPQVKGASATTGAMLPTASGMIQPGPATVPANPMEEFTRQQGM